MTLLVLTKCRIVLCLFIVAFVAACSDNGGPTQPPITPVACDCDTLVSFRDNTLYEDTTGAWSNGAGRFMFVGLTNSASTRRALLAFGVANSGIQAGATIDSVFLVLHMSRTIAGAKTVSLHRTDVDWGEAGSDAVNNEGLGAASQPGDATWIHTFFDTTLWSTAGGDFDSVASASTLVDGDGFYVWNTTRMVADVQGWLDDPVTNHGWVLVGDESGAASTKRFATREITIPEFRPRLIVFSTDP